MSTHGTTRAMPREVEELTLYRVRVVSLWEDSGAPDEFYGPFPTAVGAHAVAAKLHRTRDHVARVEVEEVAFRISGEWATAPTLERPFKAA